MIEHYFYYTIYTVYLAIPEYCGILQTEVMASKTDAIRYRYQSISYGDVLIEVATRNSVTTGSYGTQVICAH